MAHEEVAKNHQGGIQSDENYESDTRMYENDPNGGFKYLMLYLSKINKDVPALFHYPKKNFLSNDTIWYNRKHLCVNNNLVRRHSYFQTPQKNSAYASFFYTKFENLNDVTPVQ